MLVLISLKIFANLVLETTVNSIRTKIDDLLTQLQILGKIDHA
jgi:hypothetical protein